MSDGMSGEGGGVVGDADHQSTAIFHDVVNSIRNGDPHGIGAEVVIIDATRGRFPTTARIFEISNEFAFLAVYTDDGQMTALEAVAQLGEIFELKIAVGTRTGRDLLLVDPQRIAHAVEQTSDGVGRDGNAEFGQLFGNRGSRAARPS
jgi:hypothetical protein